jgi:hypothetical protein
MSHRDINLNILYTTQHLATQETSIENIKHYANV